MSVAPSLPITFEVDSINYTFTNFDGGGTTKIANPQSSGINTSANVGKMIKSAGQPWGGSWISLASPIDFSANKVFKVKVYMPKVGAKLLLKVENQTDGGINFEKEATGTVANGWEELTFDYSAINVSKQYQKLVIIFDLGTMGDGSANFTYLFDDIKLTNDLTGVSQQALIATEYGLNQNYPNPFNPSTTISYSLEMGGMVSLKVFNLVGQEVAMLVNQEMGAGFHTAVFDASQLSSGIYFYQLRAGTFLSLKKMMLLK